VTTSVSGLAAKSSLGSRRIFASRLRLAGSSLETSAFGRRNAFAVGFQGTGSWHYNIIAENYIFIFKISLKPIKRIK
jgi:hypothetical protein